MDMAYFSNLALHESCQGCGRIDGVYPDGLCKRLLEPSKQWTRLEGCSHRTHSRRIEVKEDGFIDPLKASKRKAKGRKT